MKLNRIRAISAVILLVLQAVTLMSLGMGNPALAQQAPGNVDVDVNERGDAADNDNRWVWLLVIPVAIAVIYAFKRRGSAREHSTRA